jgi:hypothetical protein
MEGVLSRRCISHASFIRVQPWLVRRREFGRIDWAVELPARGLPESQPRSKSFGLRDNYGHIGQLDLASRLGRLSGHELPNACEDGLLHGKDLGIDVPPEHSLLERRGGEVRLSFHAQRIVTAPGGSDNVGPVEGSLVRSHGPLIHPSA